MFSISKKLPHSLEEHHKKQLHKINNARTTHTRKSSNINVEYEGISSHNHSARFPTSRPQTGGRWQTINNTVLCHHSRHDTVDQSSPQLEEQQPNQLINSTQKLLLCVEAKNTPKWSDGTKGRQQIPLNVINVIVIRSPL